MGFSRLKIVIINFASGLPDHGPTYRSHHLAESWAARGHDVTYVAASYSHLQREATSIQGPHAQLRYCGVDYRVLNAPRYRGSGLSRMRNILTCLWRLRGLETELAHSRPDAIIAATVYQLDNFCALRIARTAGAAFVRETRDLWPETLTDLGGYSPWHPFVRWVGAAERLAYRHANAVTTTLSNSRDYMVARGLPGDRWHYLPQCPVPRPVGPTATLPFEHAKVISQLHMTGRKIALFAGSLVPASQLGLILDAAAELIHSKCHIVVVGRGPEEGRVRAALHSHPKLPLTLLPAVEQAAVPGLISAAHVGVAALGPHSLYRHGISLNKVFEYLNAGCPVVLAAAAPGNVVEVSGAGMCVPPNQPVALATAIREVCALSRAQRDELGSRGRAYVLSTHDFSTMAARYLELLSSVRLPHTLTAARNRPH